MAFSSIPHRLGPLVVRGVLCTTGAGAMLRVEQPGGRRQTVLLLDPEMRSWPARLRDRQALPPHPRLCGLDLPQEGGVRRVRQDQRTFYYVGSEALTGWTALDEIARDEVLRGGAQGPWPGTYLGQIAQIGRIDRALRLCTEAAEALAWAHQADLPHGHLEPGCLFIQTYADDDEGHVKLLGAGLRVSAGPASRAARYQSPQWRSGLSRSGSGAARRSRRALMGADVFALSGILYHLITGEAPDATDPAGLARHLQEIAALGRPGVSRLLGQGLSSGYASADALREALVDARAGGAVGAVETGRRARPERTGPDGIDATGGVDDWQAAGPAAGADLRYCLRRGALARA